MKDTDTFQANLDFVCREIAGDVILVPTGKTAEQFSGLASLNQTGLFMWNLLKTKRTFAELSSALAEEYELTGEKSREDVTDYLKTAIEKNIVIQC